MSVNVNSAHLDHHRQPTIKKASDAIDDNKDAPTALTAWACNEGKAPGGARKRPSKGDINNDPNYTLASCNSAFLQGLFEDIASTCMTTTEEDKEDEHQSKVPDDDFQSTFSYVSSEHNMAKRRLVSTTRSLERCGHSLSNVLSSLIMTLGTTTNNTTTIMPANAKDFPTTVSASLSFHLQRTKTMTVLLDDDDDDEKVSPVCHCETSSTPEGDFGWFVYTDIPDGEQDHGPVMVDPYATAFTPLAFSAPTAPLASHHDNDRAEVEWAQAADTVDEVLGDLFF
jgi:hypothetical protein